MQNRPKMRLRDPGIKRASKIREWAKIFQDPAFSRNHFTPLKGQTFRISADVVWGPGGVIPYMVYAGMCCRMTGYGFCPLCPKQGILFHKNLS